MRKEDSDVESDWACSSDSDAAQPTVAGTGVFSTSGATTTGSRSKGQKVCSDPAKERERIRKLEERRDKEVSGNLFGADSSDKEDWDDMSSDDGMEFSVSRPVVQQGTGGKNASAGAVDPLEALKMTKLTELEALAAAIKRKLSSSPVNSKSCLIFLNKVTEAVTEKMVSQDVTTYKNGIVKLAEAKMVEANRRATNSKKGSDLRPNIKDPRSELESRYGGYSSESD